MSLADQKASIEYIQNEASTWLMLHNTAAQTARMFDDVLLIVEPIDNTEYTIEEMDAAFEALRHVESL